MGGTAPELRFSTFLSRTRFDQTSPTTLYTSPPFLLPFTPFSNRPDFRGTFHTRAHAAPVQHASNVLPHSRWRRKPPGTRLISTFCGECVDGRFACPTIYGRRAARLIARGWSLISRWNDESSGVFPWAAKRYDGVSFFFFVDSWWTDEISVETKCRFGNSVGLSRRWYCYWWLFAWIRLVARVEIMYLLCGSVGELVE